MCITTITKSRSQQNNTTPQQPNHLEMHDPSYVETYPMYHLNIYNKFAVNYTTAESRRSVDDKYYVTVFIEAQPLQIEVDIWLSQKKPSAASISVTYLWKNHHLFSVHTQAIQFQSKVAFMLLTGIIIRPPKLTYILFLPLGIELTHTDAKRNSSASLSFGKRPDIFSNKIATAPQYKIFLINLQTYSVRKLDLFLTSP